MADAVIAPFACRPAGDHLLCLGLGRGVRSIRLDHLFDLRSAWRIAAGRTRSPRDGASAR